MKKQIITTIVATAMVATAVIGLCGCKPAAKSGRLKTREVYAMSAVTSASYLSQGGKSMGVSLNGNVMFADEPVVPPAKDPVVPPAEPVLGRPAEIKGDIENINQYVNMFKGCLLDGGLNQTITKPTEADGKYSAYSVKLSVTTPSAAGSSTSILYFNEVATETETEIGEEEEADEVEVATTLEGVLVVDGKEFKINGEKNVETEGTETETEITFTTRSTEDQSKFIVVKQEVENQEVEYEYEVHDGAKVSKTAIEFESEDGEEELSIVFKNSDGTVANKTKYSLDKKTVEGKTFFEVSYLANEVKSTFKIYTSETTNRFVYPNGFEETL